MKAFLLALTALVAGVAFSAEPGGNRLTYLDSGDPFYPQLGLARFTTPQWVGEEGVEAVVILSIDDLRETKKYEAYLRPILERLKGIDGRAPVSIMCNQFPPEDPQFAAWLKEGLSLDVHTLAHPCPLLRNGDFSTAQGTYHGGVDLLTKIPGNRPVAFRMPCCDSMNSPSPRFFAEIFPGVSGEGRFLSIDSSIMGLLTSKDASLPRELVLDPDGRERFRKYFPNELVPPRKITFERFASYIEDYPYPYVIGRVCWEFPCAVPSDWEAFNLHGAKNPRTLEDWKAALDAIVRKQGIMPMVLHPHGWSDPQQIVEFIDHAVAKNGRRVKFLTFREALERLEKNALAGQSLRYRENGGDNGARLLDVNNDGFMDVVIGNEKTAVTRVWEPAARRWADTPTPALLNGAAKNGGRSSMHARFGVVRKDRAATMLVKGHSVGAWHFEKGKWQEAPALLNGLDEVSTGKLGIDGGVRLRDFDSDDRCELLASTAERTAIYRWSDEDQRWQKAKLSLPDGVSLLNERGEDNGLRFVDLNADGFDDVLFSNEERYGIHLWAKTVKPNLGWQAGWSHLVAQASSLRGGTMPAGSLRRIPPIVRAGPNRNNGAWFKDGHLVIQNEDTSKLDGVVERRSFKELIAFDVPPPKSPDESLACLRARPGFKAELVAAEPLVVDPIALEWDARGRLWVVEMRDYPLGIDGNGKPGGVIKVLEDTDEDGRYDKAAPFLEGIPFPTGVMPWRNGALIAATPDLLYAEDTDGDGRADTRRVLFTGFKEGNQQHRFNGFEYGLDNWIYCANGDSGGTVTSIATGATLNLSGRDFRFRPDTGEMQAIEGQAQYGRRCDDWGNWFGNNNPTWLWHYPIPERYIARNPQLVVKSLKRVLANYPEPTRVFPLSVPLIRFNQPQSLNHVTSACSAAPYRDDLFGPEFGTSVFVSEPVHNVVHREVLAPDGVSFKSERAGDERDREFLASTDNWFRPTMLKTGPDGALYIADMYRFVLEHPEWIAPEAQARLDLRAGEDKGRIYRVAPEMSARRQIPNLAKLDTVGLAAALDAPGGWQRTTAQRLLVERGDKAAGPLLASLARKAANPKARLHALGALEGLGGLHTDIITAALRDSHPAVRAETARLSEAFLDTAPGALFDALDPLADDPELRVRYQLAFSLGASRDPRAGKLLARIAVRDGGDPDLRIAVLSSAPPHAATLVDTMLAHADAHPPKMLSELIDLAVSGSDRALLGRVLSGLAAQENGEPRVWQLLAAAGVLDALQRRGESLQKLDQSANPDMQSAALALGRLMAFARTVARGEPARRPAVLRQAAVGLLGREPGQRAGDLALLREHLAGAAPPAVQSAALAALGRLTGQDVAGSVIADWPRYGPAIRQELVALLLTRKEWSGALLEAISNARIAAGEIGSSHRQTLLKHSDLAVREHAARLFSVTDSDRPKLVQKYAALVPEAGDAANGREIFRAQCSLCHRFKNEGFELGPDLGMVAGKPLDELLTAILDPNRAIEPRYLAYSAMTHDGRVFTGIVGAETANGFTLKAPAGAEQSVLRGELKEFTTSGRSLMPEGLEQAISPEQMADLLAFLRAR